MQDATIIFDVDGTMIDTAPDLIVATNFVLAGHGLAPAPAEIILREVSSGAKAMIRAAMASHGPAPSEDELIPMVENFVDFYRENISVNSRAFPYFIEAAEELQRRGAILAVCTNKREDLARKLLSELKVDHYFTAITGGDTFTVRKPHPAHLLGTISAAGGSAGRAIMVGDSSADGGAARGSGVPFIAVSFGYGEPPETLAADIVIDSFADLVEAAERLIA